MLAFNLIFNNLMSTSLSGLPFETRHWGSTSRHRHPWEHCWGPWDYSGKPRSATWDDTKNPQFWRSDISAMGSHRNQWKTPQLVQQRRWSWGSAPGSWPGCICSPSTLWHCCQTEKAAKITSKLQRIFAGLISIWFQPMTILSSRNVIFFSPSSRCSCNSTFILCMKQGFQTNVESMLHFKISI